MANVIFNKFKDYIFTNGAFSWTGATVKCALMRSTLTPDVDLHNFWSDVSANEVTGTTNYTAGGTTMSCTVTRDDATNTVKLSASNVTWPNSTIPNARYAVIYISTGVAGTSPLVAAYDFGVDKSSSGDTFTFTVNASGLIVLT